MSKDAVIGEAPKHISVNSYYNKGSACIRFDLFMEFGTPAEADALNDALGNIKKEIDAGRVPKITFKLWTEE